jgi:hypothetical protein
MQKNIEKHREQKCNFLVNVSPIILNEEKKLENSKELSNISFCRPTKKYYKTYF